ncbi:MAG: hypothetical protein KAG66_05725, partial [Methylococcales bacterium]|nr:hypothetical protein [Methylococcales bacterium]
GFTLRRMRLQRCAIQLFLDQWRLQPDRDAMMSKPDYGWPGYGRPVGRAVVTGLKPKLMDLRHYTTIGRPNIRIHHITAVTDKK